ncbi:Rieske (2Fe-2S) protein [Methylobacterium sp. J-090]|uniref:Rieske (2Fe-2S) protein n=1 Tax=Methylobacterium sp. J-090 TaxID=2836666 RepID=UPI001FBB1F11|nr:Rieske (2Fe-2S) protein [Methylobacterium sp. J-090]MCJ2081344.1 Rieske (2Fe-2S) protein [Methylobacterium sp. J-090]
MEVEPLSGGEVWVRACARAALAGRALLPVFVAGRHLLLVRDGGRLFATERACPHEGADLAAGRCSGGRLFCPRHLAWFTLADGTVSPGWDFRPLVTYPVRSRGADVYVRIGSRDLT